MPLTFNRRDWIKRVIDVAVATIALSISSPVILMAIAIAAVETRQCGLFRQLRVGLHGRLFYVLKIRTMRTIVGITTTTTTVHDPRITPWGRFFRRTKIDELPQLWNVLRGDMSLVGPRPDVPELVNSLPTRVRKVLLSVRPGITGPATVRYRHEEELLAQQPDAEKYNREVLFPEKTMINCEYIQNYQLRHDFVCLVQTLMPRTTQSVLPGQRNTSSKRPAA